MQINSSTKTKSHSQDRRLMREILEKLKDHKYAEPFSGPVDWKGMNLLDYPQIISQPMDLSTVENKLDNRRYKYIESFFEDIHLIWTNCITYNS